MTREWNPGDIGRVNDRGAFEHIASGSLVIDLTSDEAAKRIAGWIGSDNWRLIHEALEALTGARKPEEPTGLGAVIEDEAGVFWVRVDACRGSSAPSWSTGGTVAAYRNIAAVNVLSEGVPA